MRFMFCCGGFGCRAIEIDEDAYAYASMKTGQWAGLQKLKTGDFPSTKEQADYFRHQYQRHKNIRRRL